MCTPIVRLRHGMKPRIWRKTCRYAFWGGLQLLRSQFSWRTQISEIRLNVAIKVSSTDFYSGLTPKVRKPADHLVDHRTGNNKRQPPVGVPKHLTATRGLRLGNKSHPRRPRNKSQIGVHTSRKLVSVHISCNKVAQ